mmetsp:Transcript_69851/g.220500  ORF Transcript_69851/g.220500 Transcript_69851/m.220500 type:complete len:480 (-) Transcript_69851:53-1492(-)
MEDTRDLPETQCQYFVLSPRPSLGSPGRRPCEGDEENADVNVPGQQPEVVKRLAKSFKRVATPRSAAKQLSARPSTPNRTKTEPENVLTPHLGQASVMSLPMTPEREREEQTLSAAPASLCPETERESRLVQLSRRSSLRRYLSSKELEELQVEQKRREVHELIQRNQVTCRRALNAAEVGTAGRACARPAKVTIPKEFNFAGPTTPRTPRADLSICSDSEDASYLHSARRHGAPASARKATPTRQWRPQLTVPKGPELHTTRRLSTSGSRRSLSCPPNDLGAEASCLSEDLGELSEGQAAEQAPPPRPSTPTGRRLEVYAAASRAERRAAAAARAAAPSASAASAGAAGGLGGRSATADRVAAAPRPGKVRAAAARDRAELARRLVHQQKDEEARAAQEAICVFKKPAAAAERPRPLINPPPDWTGGSEMMSVGSTRSCTSLERTPAKSEPSKGRPTSARGPVIRPSFGSTAARPCLS